MDTQRTVILRDTTLREGIQIPGASISVEQKQAFIELLASAGVPEIEIGLPDGATAAGPLAQWIAQRGLNIATTGLVPVYVRHWQRQVDAAAQFGFQRIDVLAPCSDQLLAIREHYGMTADDIGPRMRAVLDYARGTNLQLSVALMDATRAPLDRLLSVIEQLNGTAASRLTIYDSVGVATPAGFAELIRRIRGVTDLPVLVHCHNDYGMATANTLAAFEAGAAAADVAVNGVGGRAGNAALEEVVLALQNLYHRATGVDPARLGELSQRAAEMTGLNVWPLKPIVGAFCFAHVPVMHIRCIAGGNPQAFEPYDPQQVGAQRRYDFCLPVDYCPALEPFMRKSGHTLDEAARARLLAALRARPDRCGWTEPQIMDLIQQVTP